MLRNTEKMEYKRKSRELLNFLGYEAQLWWEKIVGRSWIFSIPGEMVPRTDVEKCKGQIGISYQ